MTTVLQQLAAGALPLLFGVLALGVWRRLGPERRDRPGLAWKLTAAKFVVGGGYATLHALFSAAAITGGPRTGVYAFVVRWAVAANAGRAVLTIVFGGMLIALLALHRRAGARIAAAAPWVLLGVAAAATAAMRALLGDSAYTLSTVLAVLNALTAILLMGALLVAVLNDGMDQLLWLALGAYTLKETLSVSQLAVMAWWSVAPQVQTFRIFYWIGIALSASMVALAARRLHLARAGRRVPAVFEGLHAIRRAPTG